MKNGETLLNNTLHQIIASGLPLLVCLRGEDHRIAATLESQHIPYRLCQSSHHGMGATLAEGMAHLPQWQGVVIALADMPFIAPNTYASVAGALTRDTICLPTNDKGAGHPVGFGERWFGDLRQLKGDRGGSGIVGKNKKFVIELPCNDPNIQRDVDRPASIFAAESDGD